MASKPVKPLDWTHWRPEELVFYFAKESQLVVRNFVFLIEIVANT